jgi:predicted nucleic acid-binding protein
MTLVDSNVLLDVFSESEPWVAWSKQQLQRAAQRGPVVINEVIYAEISVQFTSFESLDAVLKRLLLTWRPHPVRHYFWRERRSGNIEVRAA